MFSYLDPGAGERRALMRFRMSEKDRSQNIEEPPRGYSTGDVPQHAPPRRRWRLKLGLVLSAIVLIPAIGIALWTWIALSYSYSTGERAGYVQKFSQRGWLCKTYEGELAMIPTRVGNSPVVSPDLFDFSVRDADVARRINESMGKRVSLTYEQHKGVPTSCFGDTEYYVSNVRVAE
jgi:hypothetical protein